MKTALDTSILVAALTEWHPAHAPCVELLSKSKKTSTFVYAHALTEFYSTVTRLPASMRFSAADACAGVISILNYVSPITLDAKQHVNALVEAEYYEVSGGRIYDYMHIACAKQIKADTLYTLNGDDFLALADYFPGKIRVIDG